MSGLRDAPGFIGARRGEAMGVDQSLGMVARRSASLILSEAREIVEPAYRCVVDALVPRIRHIAGYHVGWWDPDGRPTCQAGKAVRPALALACARAAGGRSGQAAWQAAARAAVAVELVHDFSLLHDDVMDGALTRRHRPAAWAVFGTGPAILAGDMLLTVAVEQLTAQPDPVRALRILTGALAELCGGQMADLAFEERSDVRVAECLAMAEGKTGALLGAACQLGALAGGAGQASAGAYHRFGLQLGVAFQLLDDLLGIWGDPAVTGKPAGSDLACRKKSLPVVAALASGTRAGEDLAGLYRRAGALDEQTITHAASLVEAAGGREWALAEAGRRTLAALAALDEAVPEPGGAADLKTLAALITDRDH